MNKNMEISKIAVLLTMMLCFRDAASTPAIIKKLREKYGKDISLQTEFNLEIFWKVREKTQKKRGLLYCGPDDKFRLRLDNTVWVSDGRTYWQYSEKNNQVVIKQLLDIDLSMHPSHIVKKYLFEYPYSLEQDRGKEVRLVWTAPGEKQKRGFAQKVTLFIDTKKLILKKLHVVDDSGNESTYTFRKTKLGAGLDEDIFTLEIPEGASVLDTRE